MNRLIWSIALFLVLLADMGRIVIVHYLFWRSEEFLRLIILNLIRKNLLLFFLIY